MDVRDELGISMERSKGCKNEDPSRNDNEEP
jgi:hypothetical protein